MTHVQRRPALTDLRHRKHGKIDKSIMALDSRENAVIAVERDRADTEIERRNRGDREKRTHQLGIAH